MCPLIRNRSSENSQLRIPTIRLFEAERIHSPGIETDIFRGDCLVRGLTAPTPRRYEDAPEQDGPISETTPDSSSPPPMRSRSWAREMVRHRELL